MMGVSATGSQNKNNDRTINLLRFCSSILDVNHIKLVMISVSQKML